jgi:hypothetical protein
MKGNLIWETESLEMMTRSAAAMNGLHAGDASGGLKSVRKRNVKQD